MASTGDATTRHRALAELKYNDILAADQATSSEDEETNEYHGLAEDEVRPAIGVSIGRRQTHLNSPTTPAVEKASAIGAVDGFFGPQPEARVITDESIDAPRASQPNRRKWSASFLASLNPKSTSSSRSSSSSSIAKHTRAALETRTTPPESDVGRRAGQPTTEANQPSDSASDGIDEGDAVVGELPPGISRLRSARSKPPQVLTRTDSEISRVSSLGDDSRFEDVSEQVNSRFKALKDSLQDSSIRLPSLPSLSVTSLAPSFMRDRTNSLSRSSNDTGQKASSEEDIQGPRHDPVDPMTRQGWHSTRAALHDVPVDKSTLSHPHFSHALEQLEGDIVILGGYRGSILRSAEPPHRQLWVPIKVGLNLRKVDLEVGLDEDADERATEKVIPDGMLKRIGPVEISRRLFKRLRACPNAQAGRLRVHDYGYDWRLHPEHLSRQLVNFLESLPSNKQGVPQDQRGAVVIAHSLGGLITRHAVNQRPELFSGVVYAGVPTTCINILGPLRNGDEVLLSDKVLTAQVNFTIRTSFALLPLNGRCFIDKNSKEEYPVDFFDPQTWVDYRLSPCVARPLPPLVAPSKTGLAGYVSSVTSSISNISLPGLKQSISKIKSTSDYSKTTVADGVAEPNMLESNAQQSRTAVESGNIAATDDEGETKSAEKVSPRTAVTIPYDDAMAYLTRTLAKVKKFKQELAFVPSHESRNIYPPISVIYGKSTPTVYGARVDGREGIKHADAYDDLAFASGDGVVLARAAMVPDGYRTAKRGVVSSQRGHVTLLSDLEAVGKCLNAIITARRRGVGLGQ